MPVLDARHLDDAHAGELALLAAILHPGTVVRSKEARQGAFVGRRIAAGVAGVRSIGAARVPAERGAA